MYKKIVFRTLLGLLGLFIAYLLYVFVFSPRNNLQPIYLVPNDAVFILESDRPVEGWQQVSDSKAWSHLVKNKYFSELTESIQMVDTLFNNRRKLFKQFDGRSLFISVHMISEKEYGIFFVVDLKQMAKLNLIKTYLNTLLNDNFTLSKRNYHGHEIIEVFDRKNKNTMHLAFVKNQLVASYTHTLIEASIDQYQEPVIGRDLNFIKINEKVGFEDLFRLYVHYDYFDDYAMYFSSQPNEWVKTISDNFLFSGFHIDLEDELLKANGFTNIGFRNNAYLSALQKSGTAERSAPKVAPRNTALYLSYGFEDFNEFYSNFETIKERNPEKFKAYDEGILAAEKFLKINVKENFFSWIDDEIALIQLKPKIKGQKNDLALFLKVNNIDSAQENLDFILERIRKRTPVKFKTVDYKGFNINFLSIKGFFKLILGSKFKAFDKPYFTMIDEFVVFANNPNVLKSIITDFKEGYTLGNSKEFTNFDKRFSKESSLFVYANTPLLYDGLYEAMDAQTKLKMRKNKDFIICFPEVGFQMRPENDLFASRLVTKYQPVDKVNESTYFNDTQQKPKSQPVSRIPKGITERVFDLSPIYPSDLNARSFERHYASGALRFSVELKDGKKHGDYRAFYLDGTTKLKGRFKEDEQIGTWRFYNREGVMVLKKKFK